jgi:glycosyltransferase involved in cell wall biosynthesis
MKVISIGTDRKIFEEGSAVLSRTEEYAKRAGEMHVVVFTLKKEHHGELHLGNLHVYPTNSLSRWLYVRDGLRIGRKIAASLKIAAISTQDPFQTGYVGAQLKKEFKFPLQVQVHTDFLSGHFGGFFNSVRKVIAAHVLRYADRVRAVSEPIGRSLEETYPRLKGKIDVLPIFVDVEAIASAPVLRDIRKDFPQWKFHIFMASRLTQEKRFDVALQTLKRVVEKYPYAGLVIAGSGDQKGKIGSLAEKMGIEKHVALIGWQKDLISYYKTCNVFLLTSEFEGYGMTLVEAGAAGAMIVTTDVGVAKTELFQDEINCHICPVGDAGCLSNCILGIVRDNPKRELFGRRLQDAVRARAGTKEGYYEAYAALLRALLRP